MQWVPFTFGEANAIAKQEHELKELICERVKKKTRQTVTAVIFVFGLKVFES